MTASSSKYLHPRILKINVGFLLSAGPGVQHDSELNIPATIKLSDDLLVKSLRGTLRLTRTKEGILLQGQVLAGYDNVCSRCLDTVHQELELVLEDLYTHPASHSAEFAIGGDAMLDLAPLLRAEILITAGYAVLCQPDCKGLCPVCGSNRNRETCDCELDYIDPRLAVLKTLLDDSD